MLTVLCSKNLAVIMGGSISLVDMGGDLYMRDHGFKS